jgi:uncharacterized membrane protein
MRALKWLLSILFCAWLGQYLLALALPNLIMEVLYDQGADRGGYNQLEVRAVSDETYRSVVRPSPDLLYASCIYNLEHGPLLIEAQIPERYWSMQFYQMNTDNYAGITNQRDERSRVGSVVKVTLIGVDEDAANYHGTVIQSPTERGIVLLRASAIGDRLEQLSALEASSCRPADGER